jgi:hypothetical protein
VVMIEGEPPGIASNRARHLGGGNTFRVGAILLFSYFFMMSLFSALTLPLLTTMHFLGMPGDELLSDPTLNVVYTAFQDISGLLALPIWSVAFTLLYFDNRVRKEAYDVELLARDVAPGLKWQPAVRESAFGYQMASGPAHGRAYVQTSPLGLAGHSQYRAGPPPRPPAPAPAPINNDGEGGRQAALPRAGAESNDLPVGACSSCGSEVWENTRFCSRCGVRVNRQ